MRKIYGQDFKLAWGMQKDLGIFQISLDIAHLTGCAIVTLNLQQARRIADYTVFMNDGRVVDWGATAQIFSDPQQELTRDYLAFGG